jgi:hypothetical protein
MKFDIHKSQLKRGADDRPDVHTHTDVQELKFWKDTLSILKRARSQALTSTQTRTTTSRSLANPSPSLACMQAARYCCALVRSRRRLRPPRLQAIRASRAPPAASSCSARDAQPRVHAGRPGAWSRGSMDHARLRARRLRARRLRARRLRARRLRARRLRARRPRARRLRARRTAESHPAAEGGGPAVGARAVAASGDPSPRGPPCRSPKQTRTPSRAVRHQSPGLARPQKCPT